MRVLFLPAPRHPNSYLGLVAKGLGTRVQVLPNRIRFRPRRGDILHIHWPERYFGARSLAGLLRSSLALARIRLLVALLRRRGGALVWTAHNLAPHDRLPPAEGRRYRRFMQWFLPRIDIALAMSERQVPMLRERFPEISAERWRVAAHPAYEFPPAADRDAVLAGLDIPGDARVVAMLGLVRSYKGIPGAIEAFLEAAGPRDYLVVAGRCADAGLVESIRSAMCGSPQVRFLDKWLSDQEIASYLGAADLALYNFTAILNSGSVMAALSAKRRVLAPGSAALAEIAERVGPGWIEQFDRPLRATDIRRALDVGCPQGAPHLTPYAATAVGDAHMRAYADALGMRR